jgi:hypothetical protein
LIECVVTSCNVCYLSVVYLLYYCHRAKTHLQSNNKYIKKNILPAAGKFSEGISRIRCYQFSKSASGYNCVLNYSWERGEPPRGRDPQFDKPRFDNIVRKCSISDIFMNTGLSWEC